MSEPTLPSALAALKDKVRTDAAEFRRDVGWRLPSALEAVSGTDIRQHLGAFLERTGDGSADLPHLRGAIQLRLNGLQQALTD